LLEELANIIIPNGVNAFHCDLHTLALIQDVGRSPMLWHL